MKTLAIIGAGEAAIPIINKAKEMGVHTLAFARQGSYAQNLVDVFVEENSFDIDFMARKCEEFHVNGIKASSEMTTEVTAKVAQKAKLPGNSLIGGFGGKNKYQMRRRVDGLKSVCQPKFLIYEEGTIYDLPVVVKAVDSCGKRGVSLAKTVEEFKVAVSLAKENSSDGSVLIEEYLEGGKEYSIECLSSGKLHQVIQYTEKESSGPPHFVEVAHHQPAQLTDDVKKRIDVAVSDILEALGLNCGMAHLELKIINDKIYFIEVGARHGGDHIGDTLTVNSTDFDYFKAAIECALGEYEYTSSQNVAYTGIYFHSKYNEHLNKLFRKAETADWCLVNTVKNQDFCQASSNVESAEAGYIIYKSDHKITIQDCQ